MFFFIFIIKIIHSANCKREMNENLFSNFYNVFVSAYFNINLCACGVLQLSILTCLFFAIISILIKHWILFIVLILIPLIIYYLEKRTIH